MGNKTNIQRYFRLADWKLIPQKIVDAAIEDILCVSKRELRKPISNLSVLDVGCGAGSYSFGIEKYVKKVIGIEPYKKVFKQAQINKKEFRSKVIFINNLIEDYSPKGRFDLVLSLTTIEHMSNAEESFKNIFSLLKEGGIIYLTAPNKLWPIESHYKLPFLSWLPLPIANLYVRLLGKAESYKDCAYSKSYFGMKSFFNKFPCTYEFHLPQDIDSAYIGYGDKGPVYKHMKKLGILLIQRFPVFWIFSKGFIMIIQKKPRF